MRLFLSLTGTNGEKSLIPIDAIVEIYEVKEDGADHRIVCFTQSPGSLRFKPVTETMREIERALEL